MSVGFGVDGSGSGSERGQVLPLFGLLMCLMVGVVVLLGYVTTALLEESKAQTAADAAALAGAAAGQTAADNAAAANHAVLTYFRSTGADTLVRARIGTTEKAARAQRDGLAATISR